MTRKLAYVACEIDLYLFYIRYDGLQSVGCMRLSGGVTGYCRTRSRKPLACLQPHPWPHEASSNSCRKWTICGPSQALCEANTIFDCAQGSTYVCVVLSAVVFRFVEIAAGGEQTRVVGQTGIELSIQSKTLFCTTVLLCTAVVAGTYFPRLA